MEKLFSIKRPLPLLYVLVFILLLQIVLPRYGLAQNEGKDVEANGSAHKGSGSYPISEGYTAPDIAKPAYYNVVLVCIIILFSTLGYCLLSLILLRIILSMILWNAHNVS